MPAKKKSPKAPPLPPILSDADCVESRRRAATAEKALVKAVEMESDGVRGLYAVGSRQGHGTYEVEFRDPAGFANSCGCADFRMNRLGTCKHIERVRQFAMNKGKRKFDQAAATCSEQEHVYVDVTEPTPQFRWMPSPRAPAKTGKALSRVFAEGKLSLSAAHALLEEGLSALDAASRPRVSVSRHIAFWVQRDETQRVLEARRLVFGEDVARGHRSEQNLRLTLYPYQVEGMKFLAFHGRAILADEMGLGKTAQAIAAAELMRDMGLVARVLVVSPTSLKGEWEEQLALFTGRRARIVFGSRPVRLQSYREREPWLLCNYEQVLRDVDDINRDYAPDLVILDEAQRIKNWPTKTAKSIKRLDSPHAFVLTGTPLENRIEELYSLAEFVDPLILGNIERFQREFTRWDEEEKKFFPIQLRELHQRMAPILLRRRKAEVEDDLPPRSDKTYLVPMTPEQRLRYEEVSLRVANLINVLKRRRLTKEELDRLQLLLAQMRMICDSPYILDPECRDCPKLAELGQILDELMSEPGCKVILFSEWVRMLDLVRESLEAKGIGYVEHHGGIPQQKRREHIHRFKRDPDCRVFLSSESGGVGLNLQNANVVINMDLPWNPAKLEQRIARAWRKNQKRGVRVIHLVTEDSLEQAMIGKLAEKSALAAAVVDGAEAPGAPAGGSDFLRRVGELLGSPAEAGNTAARPKTWVDRLRGRHGDAVRAVIKAEGEGPAIVVARASADVGEMRASLASYDAPAATVLDVETLKTLKILEAAGLIRFTARMESLYVAEGTDAMFPEPPPAPVRYPDKAAVHWAEVEQERKAVAALLAVGLDGPAAPHMERVLANALECANLFFQGDVQTDPATDPEHAEWLRRLPADRGNVPETWEWVGKLATLFA